MIDLGDDGDVDAPDEEDIDDDDGFPKIDDEEEKKVNEGKVEPIPNMGKDQSSRRTQTLKQGLQK